MKKTSKNTVVKESVDIKYYNSNGEAQKALKMFVEEQNLQYNNLKYYIGFGNNEIIYKINYILYSVNSDKNGFFITEYCIKDE